MDHKLWFPNWSRKGSSHDISFTVMKHLTELWVWLCWRIWSIASDARSKIISEKSVTNSRATVFSRTKCFLQNFPRYDIAWINYETDKKADSTRIVGGKEAIPNSIPWQINIRYKGDESSFCGGSIIAPNRILTAAHCVMDEVGFHLIETI